MAESCPRPGLVASGETRSGIGVHPDAVQIDAAHSGLTQAEQKPGRAYNKITLPGEENGEED